jgi:hypothetical protein
VEKENNLISVIAKPASAGCGNLDQKKQKDNNQMQILYIRRLEAAATEYLKPNK